jgi:hypothetical protein
MEGMNKNGEERRAVRQAIHQFKRRTTKKKAGQKRSPEEEEVDATVLDVESRAEKTRHMQ